jgi:hypothetical protein
MAGIRMDTSGEDETEAAAAALGLVGFDHRF